MELTDAEREIDRLRAELIRAHDRADRAETRLAAICRHLAIIAQAVPLHPGGEHPFGYDGGDNVSGPGGAQTPRGLAQNNGGSEHGRH